jgi:3-deoxy-D-manno-octulosonic-acid transferase
MLSLSSVLKANHPTRMKLEPGGLREEVRGVGSHGTEPRKRIPSWIPSWMSRWFRGINATLRYRVQVPPSTRRLLRSGEPFLLAFWHGRVLWLPFIHRMGLPGGSRLPTLMAHYGEEGLVSRIVAHLGLAPLGVSPAAGGRKALERHLRAGEPVAVATDGPAGQPGRQANAEILALAGKTGVPIVPVSWSARPRWRTASWDRLQVPAPFARVHVAFGEPLLMSRAADPDRLEEDRRVLSTRLRGLAGRTDAEAREARIAGWMFLGYTLGIFLVSLLILPWLLWKIVSVRNRRTAFVERMGLKGWSPEARGKEDRPLWVHTVSVGEVLSTVPFLRKLKERCPGLPIAVSSITPAGRAMAREMFSDGERITCFPFDYPIPVWLALRNMRPRFFLHTETEIWPYFLLMLGRRRIPTAIVNGRMSAASCERFGWFRFFLKRVLGSVRVFAMQSRTDCFRIIRIGADPGRVYLTGNMKFDVPEPEDAQRSRIALREEMGFGEESLVLVAGSTHDGEEQVLLGIYAELKKELPRLRMLIAPRHPERCGDVERMCEEEGLSAERRTNRGGKGRLDGKDVLLLDTMGELARAYATADVVFVGGSLVPIGGHNPLEPILYRRPVLFGPHTDKIADTVQALVEAGGGIVAGGREELLKETRRLLADPVRREAAGRAAHGILERNRGAADRNLAILRPLLYPDKADDG